MASNLPLLEQLYKRNDRRPLCFTHCRRIHKRHSQFRCPKSIQALVKNAFEQPETFEEYAEGKGRRALDSYIKYGYIPVQDPVADAFHKAEQTSRTLEYAYDDYVLACFAQALGDKEIEKNFTLEARTIAT